MPCFKCDEKPKDVIKTDAVVLLKKDPQHTKDEHFLAVYIWEPFKKDHPDHAEKETPDKCRFTHQAVLSGKEGYLREDICRNRPDGGPGEKDGLFSSGEVKRKRLTKIVRVPANSR